MKKEATARGGRRCENSGTVATKKDGTCGCGIVIKGVERKKWIRISKIAVPLEVCSGLSAGACIMTGILNLVLKKKTVY